MKKRILCAALAAIMLLSGCINNNQGGENMKQENLALGRVYSYDYGVTVTGDDSLSALTDGKEDAFVTLVTGKDKIDLEFFQSAPALR